MTEAIDRTRVYSRFTSDLLQVYPRFTSGLLLIYSKCDNKNTPGAVKDKKEEKLSIPLQFRWSGLVRHCIATVDLGTVAN